jgi:hypothetical protein
VALSCPVRGLELDPRTLSLLDLDNDGRVRAKEVLAALEWCKPRLRSLGELIPARDGLELSSLREETAEGRAALGAARRILAKLGRSNSILAAADVADVSQVYAGTQPSRPRSRNCFTQGDADFLVLGRNGVFYDRNGRDWDATIVKIVDKPISIRQAFFAPYKKFMRLVEEAALRFAAAKEKASDAQVAGAAAGKPPVPSSVDLGKTVGIVAALGVGVGAIGTVFGALVSGFFGLQPWWAKPVAIVAIILVISGPSMLLAFLKLRTRTVGPLLDATGWAVNGRVKVNLPLGTSLTAFKSLAKGSRRLLDDPFEDQTAKRRRQILAALLVATLAALLFFWLYGAKV